MVQVPEELLGQNGETIAIYGIEANLSREEARLKYASNFTSFNPAPKSGVLSPDPRIPEELEEMKYSPDRSFKRSGLNSTMM